MPETDGAASQIAQNVRPREGCSHQYSHKPAVNAEQIHQRNHLCEFIRERKYKNIKRNRPLMRPANDSYKRIEDNNHDNVTAVRSDKIIVDEYSYKKFN